MRHAGISLINSRRSFPDNLGNREPIQNSNDTQDTLILRGTSKQESNLGAGSQDNLRWVIRDASEYRLLARTSPASVVAGLESSAQICACDGAPRSTPVRHLLRQTEDSDDGIG